MWIACTAAAALAGGLLLKKCKVPAGLLLGAMLAVAVLNILTGRAWIWPQARVFSQIVAGIYLGCMMTREELRMLPGSIRPFLLIIGSFLALNLLMGWLLHSITDLNLITCLLSAMPGGITDAPLVAMDMGAEVSTVAVLQFVRVVFGLACLPTLVCLTDRAAGPGTERADGKALRHPAPEQAAGKTPLLPFLPTLCVGIAAGLLGHFSDVTAGTISFSLIAAAAMNLTGKASPMPERIRSTAQLLCGCCIGVTVGPDQLRHLPALIVPALLLCAGYLLLCLGMGFVVCRLFHFRLRESMLFLAPAGAVEMTFIAADLGIESPTLGIVQMFRLICVMLFFPQIFHLILRLL